MNGLGKFALLLAVPGAVLATPALAQSDSYRVEANSSQSINLNICNPEVYVSVQGDGDTDLDFVIRNARGETVHSDYDLTDITFTTLYRRSDVSCENFTLDVTNLGNVWNRYQVTLTTVRADSGGNYGGAKSDGYNRDVSLANNTKETIFYLYWSSTSSGSWGEDKLGSSTLAAGQQWNVTVNDGTGACNFDFKAVTASGREIVRNNVNVCSSYTISFE